MKLTRKNIVLMGLLLSAFGLASAEGVVNVDENAIPEVTEMADSIEVAGGEEFIVADELLEEFRQDCLEIAQGEGVSEADQPAYIETCVALSVDIERQAADEMNGQDVVADSEGELPMDETMEDSENDVTAVVAD